MINLSEICPVFAYSTSFHYACTGLVSDQMVIWLTTFLLELKGKLNLISMISQLLVVITMMAEIEAVLSISNQWEQ